MIAGFDDDGALPEYVALHQAYQLIIIPMLHKQNLSCFDAQWCDKQLCNIKIVLSWQKLFNYKIHTWIHSKANWIKRAWRLLAIWSGLDHIGVCNTVFAICYTICSPPQTRVLSLPRYITWMSSVAESKSYSVYSEYHIAYTPMWSRPQALEGGK